MYGEALRPDLTNLGVVTASVGLPFRTNSSVELAWHRYTRERPDSTVYGQYHDVVVRVEGKWMFKRRELRVSGHRDFHVKESMPIGRAA